MNPMESAAPADGAGLRPAFAAIRAQLGLVLLLFALAAVGWWWTAARMQGMDDGPWTGLGTFGWFLGVWIVMMGAMMFPSVAPTVALYSRMSRKSRLAPLVFTTGYLATWAGAGVLAFLVGLVGLVGNRATGGPPVVGARGAPRGRGNTHRGGCLRADAAQGRLPGQVS